VKLKTIILHLSYFKASLFTIQIFNGDFMKILTFFLFILIFSLNISAQDKATADSKEKDRTAAAQTNVPLETAKLALAAHGGDKFKKMKTLVVRGTADVSGSPTTTFPAGFVTIYAGDRYRLEISNPVQPFKQIYDGRDTFSSIDNFYLPPINRLGLPLLQKIGTEGFTVSALPEKIKKKGFRITSPEGYYTDFFVDEKTNQIKSYEASYDYNGRKITTSVEIDKMRDVAGVIVPERYAQRFDLGQLTVYANFKAKEILVDTEVADDVFTMK
jgi:hypothetical protein